MRKRLALGIMLIALSANIGYAADADVRTCAGWLREDSASKTAFVYGWLMAVEAIKSISKVDEPAEPFLWPKGHRVGSVVLEMDVACMKPESRNLELKAVMMAIAYGLNVVEK